jgi:hypothetical protein
MFQHCDSQDCIVSTASIERELPLPEILAILIRLTLSTDIFGRNTPEASPWRRFPFRAEASTLNVMAAHGRAGCTFVPVRAGER